MDLGVQSVSDYKCIGCVACEEDDHPEDTVYKCKFDNTILTFNVETKTPCKHFHPEDYIRALNADSITRD